MGIASMVIGIVALMIGFVPFCGTWAIIPASAGIGLGIADVIVRSKRGQPKGMAIAGLILNPLAVIVIIIWWATALAAANQVASSINTDMSKQMMQVMQNMQNMPGMQPPQDTQPSEPLPGSVPMQPMQPMQPDPPQPPQPAQPAPEQQPSP